MPAQGGTHGHARARSFATGLGRSTERLQHRSRRRAQAASILRIERCGDFHKSRKFPGSDGSQQRESDRTAPSPTAAPPPGTHGAAAPTTPSLPARSSQRTQPRNPTAPCDDARPRLPATSRRLRGSKRDAVMGSLRFTAYPGQPHALEGQGHRALPGEELSPHLAQHRRSPRLQCRLLHLSAGAVLIPGRLR